MSKYWTEVARVDSSIVAIPPFRIDLPASSERVGFGAQTPRVEVDNEIELGEVLRPMGLSTVMSTEVIRGRSSPIFAFAKT